MNIKMTDNVKLQKIILDKLKENDGYCPCRIEQTPDTKCMCKEFREQTNTGTCHCGLYIKYWFKGE